MLCSCVYICVFLAVCVLCGALVGFGLVCVRLAWFSLVAWFALSCFVVFVWCCFVLLCVVLCCFVVGLVFCSDVYVATKGSRPAGCMFQAHPLQEATRGSFLLKQLSSP